MPLNLDEVMELKKEIAERFGVEVHMHDTCGAQTFSVDPDKMTPELENYIIGYFDGQNMQADIAKDGYFSVRN